MKKKCSKCYTQQTSRSGERHKIRVENFYWELLDRCYLETKTESILVDVTETSCEEIMADATCSVS